MKFWDFLKKVIKKLILIAIFIYSIFALVLGGIDFLEYWVGFEHDLIVTIACILGIVLSLCAVDGCERQYLPIFLPSLFKKKQDERDE